VTALSFFFNALVARLLPPTSAYNIPTFLYFVASLSPYHAIAAARHAYPRQPSFFSLTNAFSLTVPATFSAFPHRCDVGHSDRATRAYSPLALPAAALTRYAGNMTRGIDGNSKTGVANVA